MFLFGSDYWREVVNFEALVRHGTIAREDLKLFEFVDEPNAALARLKSRVPPPPPEPRVSFAKSRLSPRALRTSDAAPAAAAAARRVTERGRGRVR